MIEKMKSVFKELERIIGVYDPYIIKLNRHKYYHLTGVGIVCASILKIDECLKETSEGFQHPRMSSYNKIKIVCSNIKHTKIDCV